MKKHQALTKGVEVKQFYHLTTAPRLSEWVKMWL